MQNVAHRGSSEVADLHRRIKQLEDALRPFAEIAEDDFAGSGYEGRDDATDVLYLHKSGRQVTMGDFREAVYVLHHPA